MTAKRECERQVIWDQVMLLLQASLLRRLLFLCPLLLPLLLLLPLEPPLLLSRCLLSCLTAAPGRLVTCLSH